MKAMMRTCSTMMLILSVVACSGINSAYNARPKEPLNMEAMLEPLEKRLEKLFEKDSNITSMTKDQRNEYIYEMITIININYSRFVHDLQINKRDKDMLVDVTTMSLGLAGTAVGSAATKTVLAAVSSGIGSANGFIDKNYFYDIALPSMIAQMDKDRKLIYLKIVTGKKKDLTGDDSYPWAEAAQDLIDYYNAGTLPHAAASISADAGETKKDTQFEIDKALQTGNELKKGASKGGSQTNATGSGN